MKQFFHTFCFFFCVNLHYTVIFLKTCIYPLIFFTDKPVVSVQRLLVNAAETVSAELICTVHGVPLPTVNWLKDGLNVVITEKTKLEVQGHDHILRISKVDPTDFGDYTCSAKNYLGKAEKTISLIRTPVVTRFVAPKEGKEIVLTWEVESADAINEHVLQYRKANVSIMFSSMFEYHKLFFVRNNFNNRNT